MVPLILQTNMANTSNYSFIGPPVDITICSIHPGLFLLMFFIFNNHRVLTGLNLDFLVEGAEKVHFGWGVEEHIRPVIKTHMAAI